MNHDDLTGGMVSVATDGAVLSVQRVGGGQPVLMVHGSGGGQHSWRPVADLVAADGYEVWLPARRAYVPSRAAHRTSSFQQEVADLVTIIETMPEPPHVVGASYGALVALQLGRQHGQAVASVALWEPPLFAVGPHLTAVHDRYAALTAAREFAAANVLLMREVAQVPEAMVAASQPTTAPVAGPDAEALAEAAGWLSDLHALSLADPDPRTWTVSGVPVLLLQGSDTWEPMPSSLDRLAQQMPDLRRVVIEGQMHFAPSLVPERVAAELLQFWNTLSVPAQLGR